MKDLIAIILGLIAVVAIVVFIGAIVALPIMWMWNYVMPAIFGLPELGFWQAFWGTIMVKLLFPSTTVTNKS